MKRRILIVDDEEIVVRSCLRILSGDEFDVEVARDGLEALLQELLLVIQKLHLQQFRDYWMVR